MRSHKLQFSAREMEILENDRVARKHRAWFLERKVISSLLCMYIEKTRFLYYIKLIAVSYVFVKDFIVDVTSYKYSTNISNEIKRLTFCINLSYFYIFHFDVY